MNLTAEMQKQLYYIHVTITYGHGNTIMTYLSSAILSA